MVLLVGLSEMMLREGIGDRPPLPDAYRQDMTRIHAGAQQLGSLVRDVLDLARSQLGQLKLAQADEPGRYVKAGGPGGRTDGAQ